MNTLHFGDVRQAYQLTDVQRHALAARLIAELKSLPGPNPDPLGIPDRAGWIYQEILNERPAEELAALRHVALYAGCHFQLIGAIESATVTRPVLTGAGS